MLIRLMKHEFRATSRIMLPLYLILLVTAVGANLTTRGILDTDFVVLNMLGGLLVAAFFIALMGVCVMSLVLMIQRFYKNLLGDEGYVMMTLPVSVHQQVWSKIIVSTVWFALTAVAVVLAFCIVAYQVGLVTQFFRVLGDLLRKLTAYYALNGAAMVLELLVLCFVSAAALCLQFYAALAIGHSRPSHKLAWSVLFFFVLQFAIQMISAVFLAVFDESPFQYWFLYNFDFRLNGMTAFHVMMVVLIVLAALYGAVFYFLTTFFLKKHLNLE